MEIIIFILVVAFLDIVRADCISSRSGDDNGELGTPYPTVRGIISLERSNLDKIELKVVAQGSAKQAHTAVASQDAAAHQASYLAKITLARLAAEAATAAQTALLAKQALLVFLEKQLDEAHTSLQAELAQLKEAEATVAAATKIQREAHKHVTLLTDILKNAEHLAEQAVQTFQHAEGEFELQSRMVVKAKQQFEVAEDKVIMTQIEFSKTQEATDKATEDSQIAQINAAKAGEHNK